MNMAVKVNNLVGIFDSGVGGLSVLREIRALLPAQPLFYVADQAHVPYGKRQLSEIRGFSTVITQFLLDAGSVLIVVACNTASAAALKELRNTFPNVPFVGMEPAVKPASQNTKNGVVGVLATPATFQGELYATLVEKFAHDVKILTNTLPGMVEEIEGGRLEGPAARSILEKAIRPMVAEGADTLVLGCTHYPFIMPLIREIAGPNVDVIDPAPAIARRTKSLLQQNGLENSGAASAEVDFATTGRADDFKDTIHQLLGIRSDPLQLVWDETQMKLLLKCKEKTCQK
jgi:glutamate racemase